MSWRPLRPVVLAATLMVLVQAAIGMVVNLYVTIPNHHPGASPSDYFSGSFHSVVSAIGHGSVGLAIHTAFGLVLVGAVIGTAIRALRLRAGAIAVWSSLAALLVIGAGFNGASFLDFKYNANSLVMALLAFAAIACYTVVMFLLVEPPHRAANGDAVAGEEPPSVSAAPSGGGKADLVWMTS